MGVYFFETKDDLSSRMSTVTTFFQWGLSTVTRHQEYDNLN